MDGAKPSGSYRAFGQRLKALRTRAGESLAETAGSVEIEVKLLASYELGQARPSEDVLLLLISHFGILDDEAVKLWELAGYGLATLPPAKLKDGQKSHSNSSKTDDHILFTDVVDIVVNNYGVVMSFMQSHGPNAKPAPVARVGMSREHAKSVLQILQMTLSQTERSLPRLPKKLIAPDNPTDNTQA